MMKRIFTIIFLIFFVTCVQAEIVVVGYPNHNLDSLNSMQVEDIFMGRTRSLPNGQMVLTIDQSELRAEFYQKLTARPIEQVDAYWARIQFSGKARSPEKQNNDNEVIDSILKKSNANTNVIGYIDSKHIDRRIRVLFILN